MANHPLLSVCVVTYNQVEYVEYCLKSILRQTTNFPFEILVGDDCSTDGTRDVLERLVKTHPGKIQLVQREKNLGWTENMLSLYRMSRGKYIAHIDGDDAMLPGKLQAQVNFFEKNPKCSIVAHNARGIDNKDHVISESWATQPLKNFYTVGELVEAGTFFVHSSKMFKKTAMISHFRDRPTVDFFLHIEHALAGVVGYIDQVLCEYRLASGISSVSSTHKLQVLVAHLDAYQLARDKGVDCELVDAAEMNFRYVQGMMALRAGRYDLYKFLISRSQKGLSFFSRYTLLSSLTSAPKVARALVGIIDRLRGA